ncbi:hypothetical protein [Rhizobium multihospitium]|uniref:MerR HTH family regulatory protein n=1 Tax=Rhizobium multihospitium TaxID=410764 RepID=A0A1C3WP23_9HYPH|nr:hypothetical protein [Rhizobium multihospitium]SCB41719.1 hypothetical protein GA0061103_5909 [Rhizobium multihospitium]
MTLPIFWRRADFSVAETADIVDVPEDTLRGWLARNLVPEFTGVKSGSRLWFSAHDALYFAILRELTAYGVSVRPAMREAGSIANNTADGELDHEYMIVRTNGAATDFEMTDAVVIDDKPGAVIPLRGVLERVLDRAAAVHATEAS